MARLESRPWYRRHAVILVLVAICIGLGLWHAIQVRRGQSDPVTTFVRAIITPPAIFFGRIGRWFQEQGEWLTQGRKLANENRELKKRLADLERETNNLRTVEFKYRKLKQDLGFIAEFSSTPLPAEIVSFHPDKKFQTLIIARGSVDKVKQDAVVVTRTGLLGRVLEVGLTTSSVLLITDENSRVGAKVQRSTSNVNGIIRGQNESLLRFTELASDANIKKDDVIVTSGLGKVFPKGLPTLTHKDLVIGTVVEVKDDNINGGKLAIVRPKVDFRNLLEVFILQ